MNSLIKRQSDFLRLLLTTSANQQVALIKTIQPTQMKAVVQIAYNVLMGNRALSSVSKKTLGKRKIVIRRFVSQGVSYAGRKRLLLRYFKYIGILLKAVLKEL